nr:protein kinesin light chain-related 1 [Quercus suber]
MALICEAKGDYESALKYSVLASTAMIANGQDNEVAAIDVSIGDCVSANLIRLYFPSLRIYAKPMLGALSEDISSGSTEISAIYETINELEEALKLLVGHEFIGGYDWQHCMIEGIEA